MIAKIALIMIIANAGAGKPALHNRFALTVISIPAETIV
jgi:hypothetical protein